MPAPAGEASRETVGPSSSGSSTRCCAFSDSAMALACSGVTPQRRPTAPQSLWGVLVQPGHTQLTVMPSAATLAASPTVSPMTPCLAALYGMDPPARLDEP